MERHAERLIEHLLDAGRPVTVVARTCRMSPREGLRFRRIRTPARPFAIAYPAFFAVASVLLRHRRGAVLHTTGAIVANPVDVSTVHYCHYAAAERVNVSRASGDGLLYWLNARFARVSARAGERWCYRPQRTRILCAVSKGVADELCEGFPAMAAAIRSIPNGVDSNTFRPDPQARRAVRGELGLDEATPLALFVGGDWERKGLAFAVRALAAAPAWHLAVAGAGETEPLLRLARLGGTEQRLRFLGRMHDMPRIYAAADAFVLPTTYEAFPLVSLEAAATGLPLLITRVNGVDEVLDDGRNGWFIEREAEDIARRLNELGSDPERARTMAAAARAAIKDYSWQAMANRYLSVYAELVATAPGAQLNGANQERA
ncbi:MAG: glycosyltransferase family 4 protein [Solirubrobacteraceae bacterium]